MSRGFSDRRRFWDEVTSERMEEVGDSRPFDLMVRGRYVEDLEDISSLNLGEGDDMVEMDIVCFDLEECFLRAYEVDLGSVREGFSPEISDGKVRDFSQVVDDLANDWGYELGMIVFDAERDYTGEHTEPLEGTVYWPERTGYTPEGTYRDVEKMLGTDLLSEL